MSARNVTRPLSKGFYSPTSSQHPARFTFQAIRFCTRCQASRPIKGGTGRHNATGGWAWFHCAECRKETGR